MVRKFLRAALAAALLAGAFGSSVAWAQSRNLAPGFTSRPAASKIVILPADMELYSLSAGGVPEPRADWTEAAQRHMRKAVLARKEFKGTPTSELSEREMDQFAQLNALHGAVADAVFLHHMLGLPALPTKDKLLDWSLGDAVQPLREKSGADYALFMWVRDSYASNERKAAMVALALLGVGMAGGSQIAYASLVDLRDGRLVWFGHLARGTGDLREEQPAEESVNALFTSFPAAQ